MRGRTNEGLMSPGTSGVWYGEKQCHPYSSCRSIATGNVHFCNDLSFYIDLYSPICGSKIGGAKH